MRRPITGVSTLALLGWLAPAALEGASPSSGTVSAATPSAAWTGSFVLSDPTSVTSSLAGGPVLGCRTSAATRSVNPACDTFKLTVVPPAGRYALELTLDGPDESPNDMDFFVFDSSGRLMGLSTSEFANERIVLVDLPAGTYDVVTEAWTVMPGSAFAATARIDTTVAEDDIAKRYQATPVPPGFEGVPQNPVVKGGGQALKLRTVKVGREAAEPTNGVRKDGVAFYAAGAFDALPSSSPANAARTEILRSKDGGLTWHSVQPILPGGVTTEPPTNLDPYVYVDETTGRVFSVDLYVGCAHMWYSDDAGDTWTRNPVACGDYVNDHQTFFSGPPPPGITTIGYPNVLYYCFNRVADSSCGRSLDGGKTWLPTQNPAYLGVDGGVCGGLHGHGVTDSAGRVFLPKGHCGKPYVSVSTDGGDTWTAVKVSNHVGTAGTHTSVAVDAADNVYMLWWDNARRLPYLAVSRDHGMTWGTPLMIAPPGVNEVNFPTMAAGDAGRIVVSFPGTTSVGTGDLNRAWNYYVTISTNALDERPTFTYALANPVSDPIHRGNCGPGRCAGMFDFLDVIVSPASGAAWATATDTCTGPCVTGEGRADAADGLSVVQVGGPTLREKRR